MKVNIFPKTRLGKRTLKFLIAFFFLLLISTVISWIQGSQTNNSIFSNLIVGIPAIAAIVLAVTAFIMGVIAIIKGKERSLLVFITVLIGLFILILLIGELVVPH